MVLHNQRPDRTQDTHHTHKQVDQPQVAAAAVVPVGAMVHCQEDLHSRRSCHHHHHHEWHLSMEEVQIRHDHEVRSRRDRIDLVARELQHL